MKWWGYEKLKRAALHTGLGVNETDNSISFLSPKNGTTLTVIDLGMTRNICYAYGGSTEYQVTIWKRAPSDPTELIVERLVRNMIDIELRK